MAKSTAIGMSVDEMSAFKLFLQQAQNAAKHESELLKNSINSIYDVPDIRLRQKAEELIVIYNKVNKRIDEYQRLLSHIDKVIAKFIAVDKNCAKRISSGAEKLATHTASCIKRDSVPDKTTKLVIGGVAIGNAVERDNLYYGNLRDVINGLGGTVIYDDSTKLTTVEINGKTYIFDTESRKYYLKKDGSEEIEYKDFEMKDDRIIIPVRDFIDSESLTEYRNGYANVVPVDGSISYTVKLYSRTTGESVEMQNTDPELVKYLGDNNWTSIPQQEIPHYSLIDGHEKIMGEFYLENTHDNWTTVEPEYITLWDPNTGIPESVNEYLVDEKLAAGMIDHVPEKRTLYAPGQDPLEVWEGEVTWYLEHGWSSSEGMGGSQGTSSILSEVERFCREPITSTWGISDSAIEEWYLSRSNCESKNAKYNLNADNIREVTNAVRAAGVSPVFFYIYSFNEGSGGDIAGGFINHWIPKDVDTTNLPFSSAIQDANYLVQQSIINSSPAIGGGEPDDMPTEAASALLSSLPAGSIGKVYIPATAACTAEINDLNGITGDWTRKYGYPLQTLMNTIKALGGNL